MFESLVKNWYRMCEQHAQIVEEAQRHRDF